MQVGCTREDRQCPASLCFEDKDSADMSAVDEFDELLLALAACEDDKALGRARLAAWVQSRLSSQRSTEDITSSTIDKDVVVLQGKNSKPDNRGSALLIAVECDMASAVGVLLAMGADPKYSHHCFCLAAAAFIY
jgi:hypothetical protein